MLALKKETLTELTDDALAAVVGGIAVHPSCTITSCFTHHIEHDLHDRLSHLSCHCG